MTATETLATAIADSLPTLLDELAAEAGDDSTFDRLRDLERAFDLARRAVSLRRQAIEDRLAGFVGDALNKEAGEVIATDGAATLINPELV